MNTYGTVGICYSLNNSVTTAACRGSVNNYVINKLCVCIRFTYELYD